MMNLTIFCPFCNTEHYVMVFKSDWIRYGDGQPAQRAFPYLNSTEREQIISHICPQCQAEIFNN